MLESIQLFSSALVLCVAAATFKPLDPELRDFSYPFPVKNHQVLLDGNKLRMAYMDVPASKPNGETVVLLHGKNFGGFYWERTIRDLSSRGYRVIAPDQIGFGKSSKPDEFPYSFDLLAALTDGLLQTKGIYHYNVVGHSMGGMLATRLAARKPEAVNKLVLINPIGLENYQELVPPPSFEKQFEAELKANEESIRNYQRQVYFGGRWEPAYNDLIKVLVGWTKHRDYPRIAKNAAMTSLMIYNDPIEPDFKNLQMPTLLMIGTRDRTAPGRDRATPEVGKEMGRYDRLGKITSTKIPKSLLVEFPEAGHMPQIEVYDKYMTELDRFLKYRPLPD